MTKKNQPNWQILCQNALLHTNCSLHTRILPRFCCTTIADLTHTISLVIFVRLKCSIEICTCFENAQHNTKLIQQQTTIRNKINFSFMRWSQFPKHTHTHHHWDILLHYTRWCFGFGPTYWIVCNAFIELSLPKVATANWLTGVGYSIENYFI